MYANSCTSLKEYNHMYVCLCHTFSQSSISPLTCSPICSWLFAISLHCVPSRNAIAKHQVRHLLRFEFGGTEPECASWAVQPGLCVWVWSLERVIRSSAPVCSASFSWHTVLLLLAVSRAVIKTWRVDKLPLSISSRLMIWFCCYQARMDPYWGTCVYLGSCRTFR